MAPFRSDQAGRGSLKYSAAAGGGPMRVTLSVLLAGSALLRAVLILWGVIQDHLLRVAYTDVDYKVFTDAARLVAEGRSPFLRSTYRYSPLLAYIVLPNVWIAPIWGKLLFSAGDILAGWQLWRLCRLQGAPNSTALWAAIAWLCNPFTFTISTRGSCDSLVANLLLGALLGLLRGQLLLPALLYGLAVHVRIYPIVYAPAIVLFLARRQVEQQQQQVEQQQQLQQQQQQQRVQQRGKRSREEMEKREGNATEAEQAGKAGSQLKVSPPSTWWHLLPSILRQCLLFGGISGGIFLLLGLAFYHSYGDLFLQEAFLHHLTRKDPRHCFSAHWYPAYLTFLKQWSAGPAAAAEQGLSTSLPAAAAAAPGGGSAGAVAAAAAALDPSRLAPLPQLATLLALAAALHPHLPFCWLLQTVAFVAFNKVSTAQYFVWWFCLLPAALPGLSWPPPRRLVTALVCWAAAQLHWLMWGYLLEFEGLPVHLALWGASLLFLAANAALVVALVRCWRPGRSFLELSLDLEREGQVAGSEVDGGARGAQGYGGREGRWRQLRWRGERL